MRILSLSIFAILFNAALAAEEAEGKAGIWARVDSGVTQDLQAVHFPTAERGWAVGGEGLVLATSDGGKTWTKQDSGLAKARLCSVFFVDGDSGWACGDVGDGPPVRGHVLTGRPMTAAAVIRTKDGGKTWEKRWAPTNFILTDIWMRDKDSVCMVSHGGDRHPDGDTLRGVEHGAAWASDRAYRGLHAVTFVGAASGFAVGSRVVVGFMPTPKDPLYTERDSRIVRTVDGGKHWSPVKHPDIGKNQLTGISFSGEKTGWACGTGGVMLRTADGGKSWQKEESGTKEQLRRVWCSSSDRGAIVGDKGTILLRTLRPVPH